MTQLKHRDCFAKMFPRVPGIEMRESSAGKALAWESIPSGGLAAPEKKIEVNLDAWADCRSCDEFDSCYRLSMAEFTLAAALQAH